MKNKNRHKPPSRIRYELNNPMFSTRIPLDWEEEIKQIMKDMGLSKKEFIGVDLKKIKANYTRVYKKGFNNGKQEGYDEGEMDGVNDSSERWAIWYFCSICNKKIYIMPNSNSHEAVIQYMKDHSWGHAECHNK